MNLHAPERQAGESQADYRARRTQSRATVAELLAPVRTSVFRVHIGKSKVSGRDRHRKLVAIAAQRRGAATAPKFAEPRVRKVKKAIKPTWPASDDQRMQTRPVIVLGKNRERDASKRQKPKTAVAKRMDRPHRVTMMERGHAKLMKFFGSV